MQMLDPLAARAAYTPPAPAFEDDSEPDTRLVGEFWPRVREQARCHVAAEPMLAHHLRIRVLDHACAESALAHLLGAKLASVGVDETALATLIRQCFTEAPQLAHCMQRDLVAVLERDPATRDAIQVFLNQKGFQALQAHRVAHHLWCTGRSALAQFVQGSAAEVYAIDIHPAARVGSGVFIDHGTGVVIGETAVVGDDCTLFQGVTLGGTGKEAGDRHPKVGRGVLVCAGAKILGNVRIGDEAKIGAASVVLIDVPAGATAVGVPATVVAPRRRDQPQPAGVT